MPKTYYPKIIVPETCPVCGAKWLAGHSLPGHEMALNSMVVYNCGMEITLIKIEADGSYWLKYAGCHGTKDGN